MSFNPYNHPAMCELLFASFYKRERWTYRDVMICSGPHHCIKTKKAGSQLPEWVSHSALRTLHSGLKKMPDSCPPCISVRCQCLAYKWLYKGWQSWGFPVPSKPFFSLPSNHLPVSRCPSQLHRVVLGQWWQMCHSRHMEPSLLALKSNHPSIQAFRFNCSIGTLW